MTSLGYCNVMNYFNGSYNFFFLIIWLYGILSFFQSPDIVTSHNSVRNITTPLGLFCFLFSFFPPPSILHDHHSSLQCLASWPSPCQAEKQRAQPLWLNWTASSPMLIEKGKLPQHLKSPQRSIARRCQEWIILVGEIMWLSQKEGYLVPVHHVCSHTHTPAHPPRGCTGFEKCFSWSEYFVVLSFRLSLHLQ